MIAPPTRPNITNNPLPNHSFGKGPRINCLISKEEGEEDLFELIYDQPKCFMMTWEKLMGMKSTAGYDIWSEDTIEIPNYLTSTYGVRHFKPHQMIQHPHIMGDTSNPDQMILHPYIGGDTSNPNQMTQHPHIGEDISNPKTLNQMTHQKLPTSHEGGDTSNPYI